MIQAVNGPKNLFRWNEEMNRNPPWTSDRVSIPSINNPSPEGSNSACVMREDASLANDHYTYYAPLVTYGTVYTMSCYIKAINRNWFRIRANRASTNALVDFNVANGTYGTASNVLNIHIFPVVNSWYRVGITFLADNPGLPAYRYQVLAGNNVPIFDGLNQDSFYVWRPQLNYGYYPDDTFKTAEVPVT